MSLKLFAREAGIYAIGNVGLRAASLLLTPIYAHYLSMGDFGLWATLQTTIQITLILITVGMREALLRYSHEYSGGKEFRKLIGTTCIAILIGFAIVATVFLTLLPPLFRSILHRPDVVKLLVLTCLASLAQALSVQMMSYYRATNQALRFMMAGIGGAVLLFVITMGALLGLNWGVQGVLWAYIVAYAIIFSVVSADVIRHEGIGMSLPMLPKLVKFGAPLILSSAGQFTLGGASIFLLSYYAGLEVVAVYNLGYKLATLLSIAVALPFQLAFQPFIFANLDKPDIRQQAGRLLTYLLLATTLLTFLLLVASYILLPYIAPPEYAWAFLVIVFLVPGQALMGVHYFGETLLGAVKKTHILAPLSIVAMVACVGLNIAAIPAMGWLGAALASNLAALLVDSTEVAVGIKLFRMSREIEWRRIAATVGLFLVMLSAEYQLSTMGPVAFYGGSVAFFAASMIVLYISPFYHASEKASFWDTVASLRSYLSLGEPVS
jgi:O-antigen/teichoic acid export membrane protein